MAIGEVLKFGTPYVGSSKFPMPKKPVYNGDILDYNRTTPKEFTIRDTDPDERYVLQWVKVSEDLFICDRNILKNFTWLNLRDHMNMVEGKTVVIDGKYYTLRAITGGQVSYEGTTDDWTENGGRSPNEWDDYICNRKGIAELPIPATGSGVSEDSGYTLSQRGSAEYDEEGEHNKLWHWCNMYSIGSDQPNASGYIPWRGYSPAAYWENATARTTTTTMAGCAPSLFSKALHLVLR